MKKEILKNEVHEDGSHTKIEKTTITPKDGFVRHKSYGTHKTTYIKGYGTQISYTTTDPKIVRPAFIFGVGAVLLLFVVVFSVCIALIPDPSGQRKMAVLFGGAILFMGVCYVKSCIGLWKKKPSDKNKEE